MSHDGRMILPVSQPYTHVVKEGVRDADCKTESQQTLRQTQNKKAAVAAEQRAGDGSPRQCRYGEDEIGQMRDGEQHRGECYGGVAGEHTGKARHKVILQQELLVDRPEDVTTDVCKVCLVKMVEGTGLSRHKNSGDGNGDGGGKNPE